jgi:hypothetical protein
MLTKEYKFYGLFSASKSQTQLQVKSNFIELVQVFGEIGE